MMIVLRMYLKGMTLMIEMKLKGIVEIMEVLKVKLLARMISVQIVQFKVRGENV